MATEPRANLTDLFFLKPGPDVTELLLIRHAQVEAGDLAADQPLTALGHEQARLLAEHLAPGPPIEAVYASPTLRARETAAPLATSFDLPVQVLDALRDIETQRPFDRPFREMVAAEFGAENVDAVLDRMRSEASLDAMAPFVQSSASFRERIVGGIDGVLAEHPGRRIAVVTHGPVIMAYAAHLLGTPRDFALHPRLTAITSILARDTLRSLGYINATPHFGPF